MGEKAGTVIPDWEAAYEEQSEEWQMGFLAGVQMMCRVMAQSFVEIEQEIIEERTKIQH
jgi:hypothetical protein